MYFKTWNLQIPVGYKCMCITPGAVGIGGSLREAHNRMTATARRPYDGFKVFVVDPGAFVTEGERINTPNGGKPPIELGTFEVMKGEY